MSKVAHPEASILSPYFKGDWLLVSGGGKLSLVPFTKNNLFSLQFLGS
jgi:hypothetical protein